MTCDTGAIKQSLPSVEASYANEKSDDRSRILERQWKSMNGDMCSESMASMFFSEVRYAVRKFRRAFMNSRTPAEIFRMSIQSPNPGSIRASFPLTIIQLFVDFGER